MKSAVHHKEKLTTEDPELADRFNRVLEKTVEAMEESGIKYVFIGGIASGGLGRPRSTHDIDLFVVPEEAEIALRALAKHGFRTEKTDPSWLYKGFKENILVDVIFKSKGEIYLDTEMYQRIITAEFHGRRLKLVSPEDLIIIKAAAHSELTPGHWHDAIALLSHANIDWAYLIRRARRAPRRVLSLLLYAQSNDIWVPNTVINELYCDIFENVSRHTSSSSTVGLSPADTHRRNAPAPQLSVVHPQMGSGTGSPQRPSQSQGKPSDQLSQRQANQHNTNQVYAAGHLRERLAEDPRTNELDIQTVQQGNKLLLRGEVQLEERKRAVEQIARESCPDLQIENQIRVSDFKEPPEVEEIE